MRNLLAKNSVQFTIMAVIILAVILCAYTPDSEFLKRGSEFTVHIMLTCLALGLFFMVFDQKRLMYTAMGASFFLCLFLKEASNPNLIFPDKNLEPEVTIAYINVSLIDGGSWDDFMKKLDEVDADVISFAEVTPDWNQMLRYNLSKKYEYHQSLVRIDPMGMAIYSKLPIKQVDTIYHKDVPNLMSTFMLNKKPISLISTYILPPLNQALGLQSKEHLSVLAEEINTNPNPVFSVGGFNLTYWSNEISSYRNEANLINSRRDISSSGLRVKVPYDHIFHTKQMECTAFEDIVDADLGYIGIKGSFQFITENPIANRSYTSRILRF